MKRPMLLVLLVLLGIAAVAIGVLVVLRGGTPRGPDAAAIDANNHGVGLMGRYDFIEARQVFAGLVEQYPGWLDARVNLAIATLNRQDENDNDDAIAILNGVLREDPEHVAARYCLGLLTLYLKDPAEALEHFRFVADADPEDAYAAYYVGQCYRQDQDYENAVPWFERALEIDPYLRSACYALGQIYQRIDRADEARAMLELFHRLDGNPRARLVNFLYTRMGSKGEAIAVDLADPAPAPRPEGAIFQDPELLAALGAGDDDGPGSITACDINGDGALDLFVTGRSATDHGAGRATLLVNDGQGAFAIDPDHPLAAVTEVRTALWGDVDNDGRNDVYLCRRGPNQLWLQSAPGTWRDVTETSATANGTFDTVDGAMFDADHDGDLDLFCVNADGPNELLNNNLDGTFRPLAAARGIAGDGRPSRRIAVADLDRDRDTDLVVINQAPPHEVYLNDRMWDYHAADGFERFRESAIDAVVPADLQADGEIELLAIAGGRLETWTPGDRAMWSAAPLAEARDLSVADVTGDGRLDLIVSRPGGWSVLASGSEIFRADEPVTALATVLLDPGRGPAVVGLTRAGLAIWRPGPGRHAFMAVDLSGLHDPTSGPPAMRSNRSGIGTALAIRVDSRWTMMTTFRADTGPGQSRQPLAIGLGGHARADFVSLDWSDGVLQTEVHGVGGRDLAAGGLVTIGEAQRQSSSCPVLFAWNGERYEFVSDILGVGGIGFAIEPGVYGEPRPWERFLFERETLRPRRGRYEIKIGEPMEEAAYLDAVRLVAWDVPPGWSMTLDERFAVLGPEPSGQPVFYRRSRTPVSAVNDRGEDVRASIVEADRRAAPVGERDHRFIGRLARDHVLTVSFDEPLDGPAGRPVLVIDGWIEYPYSQTMFAAWQAGAEYRAPTIEASGPGGAWSIVLEQFGYPAGMPRQMSVPLDALPPGTTMLRLTTNQEIYWDRIAVAWAEPCPEARSHALPLARADVRRSGFAYRPPRPQRLPVYEYERRAPLWDTRHQRGLYTRFGEAHDLIAAADGALAIIGPGEEIHLEFDAGPPGPPGAWSRRFVLECEGWCKDMDLYTRDGETLEPLPGRPSPEREALHREYNTRLMSGH